MALCESQLESVLGAISQIKRGELPEDQQEDSTEDHQEDSPEKKPNLQTNGDIYPIDQVPAGLPLSVDYRSPVSHFIPPAVEMYAARQKSEPISTPESSNSPSPMKRKRGRPRIDKTSPEYLAKSAARKQAKEMAAMMITHNTQSGEKRKRGRPRVDKTSPEYLARKRARELEALERKTKKEYKRTGDSVASSSSETPRVKRKYTKRTPSAKKNDSTPSTERVKGKRGRPRKADALAARQQTQQPKIRVRSNLMPDNSEPINLDSDEEPNLGSPSQASDSLSWDENLRALRHIHEKYANIDKDDLYEAHLLAANFKKPPQEQRSNERNNRDDDEVLSIRSSEGRSSVKELDTRVEKLEDSSNSDSDSSSSGSGSSSSGSSSSSSSGDSSSSDSSDSESEKETEKKKVTDADDRSFGAWSNPPHRSGDTSGDESDPERLADPPPMPPLSDDISESENESADKSFQCHICRKWYSTRVTLKIHRRIHQNKGSGNSRSRTPRSTDRYECDCCNETFNRREKLWEHKAEAHRGSMTVRCEVCRKCFEDDAELAAHDRTHTADERAGRCSECGASFQRWEQLRRHRACAHNAAPPTAATGNNARLPHACAQCGKRFGHAHSLTRHMHNHAKQLYRCVVCKASFVRADQLAQHLNSHLANYKRLKP